MSEEAPDSPATPPARTDAAGPAQPAPVPAAGVLPPVDAGEARRRAALLLWLSGLAEIMAYAFFLALLYTMTRMPLVAQSPDPQTDFAPVISNRMLLAAVAAATVLGLGPALAYLLLGFRVRQGSVLAGRVAANIAMTQALVLIALLAQVAVVSLRSGNPAQLTLSVLTGGSLLALLLGAIYWLIKARAEAPRL